MTTEMTDVSMSMCSLNSTTTSQPEGEYVNIGVVGDEQQAAKWVQRSKVKWFVTTVPYALISEYDLDVPKAGVVKSVWEEANQLFFSVRT